ncbi:MAG TPA: type 1 glutamine amidotransferase [Solirubrobacteraceae bacterium]|nr:type 1 glutamine amidotransferase [Solirubrobacteraceae bacterium]
MLPALILQHGTTGPPGLLGEWAAARDIPVEVHHTENGDPWPKVDGRAFVACLGSKHSPSDRDVPVVAQTIDLISSAVRQDVPVLGLCYGGQVLADVLGAKIEPSPEPEIGWYEIETDAPDLVPAGPWLEWHYQRFTLPPGATGLAYSPRGLQAFVSGPHLGTQFHPESTIEIVRNWARSDREKLERLGIQDGEARLEAGRRHAENARAAAFQLFDAFWERAHPRKRRDS